MSNPTSLYQSLRLLSENISPQTLLCPAHDYTNTFATTLKTEIEENDLLRFALAPETPMSLESFIIKKKEIDSELAKLEGNFQGIVCGVTPSSQSPCSLNTLLGADQLKTYLKQKPKSLVVDVRENQEFSLFKDWARAGFAQTPTNVPLSRFVHFMSELILEYGTQQEILLLCKTGSRSLQIAKSLRRLGFNHVWSLDGGIAKAIGQYGTP